MPRIKKEATLKYTGKISGKYNLEFEGTGFKLYDKVVLRDSLIFAYHSFSKLKDKIGIVQAVTPNKESVIVWFPNSGFDGIRGMDLVTLDLEDFVLISSN